MNETQEANKNQILELISEVKKSSGLLHVMIVGDNVILKRLENILEQKIEWFESESNEENVIRRGKLLGETVT